MPRYQLRFSATLFSLAATIALSACGADPAEKAAVGMENYIANGVVSKKALENGLAPFFEDDAMAETRAVVVYYRGRIVAERYAPGYGPDTRLVGWSMSKSITATLIGFMVADGRLLLDDPAPVPEWQSAADQRGKITLRHLLHMEAGLDHSEMGNDQIALYEADTPRLLFLDGRENVARYAEKRPLEAAPGEMFEYSSATSHILADIMARTLTDSTDPEVRRDAMLEYLRGRLFEPLGMTSAFAEFDRSGTMLGGSLIHATPRDWGKFGEFLRNNGSVRAAQLMPTSWTRFMKTPSPGNANYGGHIWLNRRGIEGRAQNLFPGRAPSDVFAALGHLGQFVVVSPQHRLTIVRMGNTPDNDRGPINDQIVKLMSLFPRD